MYNNNLLVSYLSRIAKFPSQKPVNLSGFRQYLIPIPGKKGNIIQGNDFSLSSDLKCPRIRNDDTSTYKLCDLF